MDDIDTATACAPLTNHLLVLPPAKRDTVRKLVSLHNIADPSRVLAPSLYAKRQKWGHLKFLQLGALSQDLACKARADCEARQQVKRG